MLNDIMNIKRIKMIDKKTLINELLDCVSKATDTDTKVTGLTMCGMLMNDVIDEMMLFCERCDSTKEKIDSKYCHHCNKLESV